VPGDEIGFVLRNVGGKAGETPAVRGRRGDWVRFALYGHPGAPAMNRGKVLIFVPLEIWFFPPRFYDPLVNLEAHYTMKMPENQVVFGCFSLQLGVGGLPAPVGRYEGVRSAADLELA